MYSQSSADSALGPPVNHYGLPFEKLIYVEILLKVMYVRHITEQRRTIRRVALTPATRIQRGDDRSDT